MDLKIYSITPGRSHKYSIIILFIALIALHSCEEYVPARCSITEPLENSVFFHGDSIIVAVKDEMENSIISQVRIYLNDVLLDSSLEIPCTFKLAASDFSPGEYALKAGIIDKTLAESTDELPIVIEGKYLSAYYHAEYDAFIKDKRKPFLDFKLTFDVISEVDFDAYFPNGVLRSEDSAINVDMWIIKGISPALYTPMLENRIENATIVPEYIPFDIVSGATYASAEAHELFTAALQSAENRDTSKVYISWK